MSLSKKGNSSIGQYLIGVFAISFTSFTCWFFTIFITYREVALLLLLVVSLLAMLFDILPVLTAALLSALIWFFFFILPVFTFLIAKPEDALMFLMYFMIALLNAVLTFKIRAVEQKARDKEDKENTIKLYNTLLNSLSHELRTPIATIIGTVDTLKEFRQSLSTESQHELLSQIDMAGMRLNRQVENLLNMSRLETGMLSLKLDWCDMNEIIFSVKEQIDSNQCSHNIVFEANENLPLVKVDEGIIQQVVHNIIHNAVQYTPENSSIYVDVAQYSEGCLIIISDEGNGFSEDEIALVFDKFYRIPHSKTGGTGLGLSIVKGFVEAHRGKITLTTLETGGAKFEVYIPAELSFMNSLKNE